MHLKSLEIQGYKSFANKSIFQFDKGITAIVGPNGSGKSNISDAIRWVLGEQSYSTLRGQRTADMIFAGSANRARVGMASVGLVLDNRDGSLPLDYNEVTIARRAFRSGENEYLVNNNRIRLKDVTELLARGGLARQTYTVIGQGTIDRALSLRAEERRQLFEEAAGISFHRRRRAATLRRLDETRANLLRLNDIITEIEPRLKRLARQTEKAHKFEQFRLHLNQLLKLWYGYQWGQKQDSLRQAKLRAAAGRQRLSEAQTQFKRTEAAITALRLKHTQIRAQLGDWHAQSSQRHIQAQALQRELAVGEERARQLTAQHEEFMAEIQRLETQLARRQDEVARATDALTQADEAQRQAEQQLHSVQQTLNAHRRQRQTLQRQLQHAEEQSRRAAHTLTERQTRLEQLAERQTELQTGADNRQNTIQTLTDQLPSLEAARQQVRQNAAALQSTLNALADQETAAGQQRQTLTEQAQTLTAAIAQTEKKLAALQARQDLLSKLRADLSGYRQGVKTVLQAKSLPGVRGTVAQLLQIPPHLEAAFEAALGEHLQNIVVNTWDEAEKAIAHLKQTRAGRATFMPLDRLRPPAPLTAPRRNGVIGLATDLAHFAPDISAAAQSLLNRTLITTDMAAAKSAFDSLRGDFQIATQNGEIARSGGIITGGDPNPRRQQGSILAREREWRELPGQISALEGEIKAQQTRLDQIAAAQEKINQTLNRLAGQKLQAAQQQAEAQKEAGRQQTALDELRRQIEWHKDLHAQAERELEANRLRQTGAAQEIERVRREQTAAQEQVAALRAQIAGLSAETLLANLNQAQTNVSLSHEKQQSRRELLKTFTHTLTQTQSQLDNRRERAASLAAQKETLLARLQTQKQAHTALLEAIKSFTGKIEPAEAGLKTLEADQQTAEAAESKQRQLLRRLEAEHSRLSLDMARRQDDMDVLHRQIEDDFGLVQLELSEDQVGQPVLPLQSVVTQLPTVEQLPDGIEEELRRLKVHMRQLGHINHDAPREYEESLERYNFLTGQMEDLETAAADLKTVIEELDKLIEAAFMETFVAVAEEFQNYFKILFNGGEAQLVLTNPQDITATGVDIVARPPGKRAQNLELLSGGERSLTAQALIFALLKTSPTPYCVFDEVDAMLDEANVDRFRQALLALGRDIQFIIITHNRKTIEIADTIYGISMGNDAVSRVVSLKLEDIPEDASELLP